MTTQTQPAAKPKRRKTKAPPPMVVTYKCVPPEEQKDPDATIRSIHLMLWERSGRGRPVLQFSPEETRQAAAAARAVERREVRL